MKIISGFFVIFSLIQLVTGENYGLTKELSEIMLHFKYKIFLIDPDYLAQLLAPHRLYGLKWRFNFDWNENFTKNDTVTFGIFGYDSDDLIIQKLDAEKYFGIVPESDFKSRLIHAFFTMNDWNIHLVVLHHVQNFLWIGQIPNKLVDFPITPKFGLFEQIFDPFCTRYRSLLKIPEKLEHFLGQISTSRYLKCSEESANWLERNKIKENESRKLLTVEAIVSIKELMRQFQMQFWAMSGTLLGWYRNCGPIPYTDDTDFGTWPKYLKGKDISSGLALWAPKHYLNLFYRFGEPNGTMEYSFITAINREKIDLFFFYEHNSTHYFLPSHKVSTGRIQKYFYPKFDLCSIQMLGYKLLAPCHPDIMIRKEYGPKWNIPIKNWNYISSPANRARSTKPFKSNISQYTEYKILKDWGLF